MQFGCVRSAGAAGSARRPQVRQDPRVIESRALLVRDEAMKAAFCVASSAEEVIAQFERFIEAGCNHIIWADMSPDPFLVADLCRNEVLPYLKRKYGSDAVSVAETAKA